MNIKAGIDKTRELRGDVKISTNAMAHLCLAYMEQILLAMDTPTEECFNRLVRMFNIHEERIEKLENPLIVYTPEAKKDECKDDIECERCGYTFHVVDYVNKILCPNCLKECKPTQSVKPSETITKPTCRPPTDCEDCMQQVCPVPEYKASFDTITISRRVAEEFMLRQLNKTVLTYDDASIIIDEIKSALNATGRKL